MMLDLRFLKKIIVAILRWIFLESYVKKQALIIVSAIETHRQVAKERLSPPPLR